MRACPLAACQGIKALPDHFREIRVDPGCEAAWVVLSNGWWKGCFKDYRGAQGIA
jgi:hypothetical protein